MSLDFFSLLHLKTSTIPKTDVMTKEFDRRSWFSSVVFGYAPRKLDISPFESINRPLKIDCCNGTTYNRRF